MTEEIKKAFQRVKDDMFYLNQELLSLRSELLNIKNELKYLSENIENNLKTLKNEDNTESTTSSTIPTHNLTDPTFQHIIPTHQTPFNGLNTTLKPISTGNEGVPTDRQTDTPTDRQTHKIHENTQKLDKITELDRAGEILNSLDNLKKDLRLKLKRLTEQEMFILSLVYSLEDEGLPVDYKLLADKTNLSQSSIRDYVLKITAKKIPIIKEKLNNKRILLHISQDLKKIASLDTLLRLRGV